MRTLATICAALLFQINIGFGQPSSNPPAIKKYKTKASNLPVTANKLLQLSQVQVNLIAVESATGTDIQAMYPIRTSTIIKTKRKQRIKTHIKSQEVGLNNLLFAQHPVIQHMGILPTYQLQWKRNSGFNYQASIGLGYGRIHLLSPTFIQTNQGFEQVNHPGYNVAMAKAAVGIGHKIKISKTYSIYPNIQLSEIITTPVNSFIAANTGFSMGLMIPLK